MSGPIDPIRPIGRAERAEGVRRQDDDEPGPAFEPIEPVANLPMVVDPPPQRERVRAKTAKSDPAGTATFAAQLIGQPGIKRGLKGGPETLEAARSSYLGTEYSGRNDRRPAKGLITKTEI